MPAQQTSLRPALITGIGAVTPLGLGRESLWAAVREARSGVGALTRFDPAPLTTRIAGEVGPYDVRDYCRRRKAVKLMSREIQFAVTAARLATEDAALDPSQVEPERFAVIQGVDEFFVPIAELAPVFAACLKRGDFDFGEWEAGCRRADPLSSLKHMCVMAASHVCIEFNAQGPSNTIGMGAVSGLLALQEATEKIRRGLIDVALVGATSSRIHPEAWAKFSRLGLSERNHDPTTACRPFAAGRDGMVLAEGAAVLVVESEDHAERRGAVPLAGVERIVSRQGALSESRLCAGAALESVLLSVLDPARPADIGHVNAHGQSTVRDDLVEATVIQRVLPGVNVTAPKSYFGDLGAASALAELAISILALRRQQTPPTLHQHELDPLCAIDLVQSEPRDSSARAAVKLAYDRLGAATAVLLTTR